MRLHPLAASCVTVLLCAALASCSNGGTAQEETEPPVTAAAEPAPPTDEPAEEADGARGRERSWEAVGWAAHPLEADGEKSPGVDGGSGGDTVTAADAGTLTDLLAREGPLTIEVHGTIDLGGDVAVGSDKTLVGSPEGGALTGGRLVVDGASDVVIADLAMDTGGSAVAIRGGAHHVWIDGSTFSGGGGDALVSVTGGADRVTLSWNRFRDSAAAVDIGGADEEPGALRVTLHHNYFDGTSARNPRARGAAHVHVFNNYFRGNGEYGMSSALDARLLAEGNYFQGTLLSAVSGGDGEEAPGNVLTRDNLLVDSAQPELRGEVPDPPYSYELDDPGRVPDLVQEQAGARTRG
ncbi:polysaccharide lyase family 1 protein [Nocardiopsis sp. CNT312]|uniref:pectate lyase family protein n=1 Tax=Nocardiopsis sp. CNT312 TaxID=1137268 RepID=UPI00048C89F7|nr:right-handed parallel beta-helix repeat-containing protein [Nocardiopsis sp. CNT312]